MPLTAAVSARSRLRKQCLILALWIAFAFLLPYSLFAGEREDYQFAYELFQSESSAAKGQLEAFLQKYPRSDYADDVRLMMGDLALQSRKYDEAISHFKQLTVDYPESPLRVDAVRGVAEAWNRQGKYVEAIQAYEDVVSTANPSRDADVIAASLFAIGEGYYQLESYKRAIENYDRILKQFPQAKQAPQALYAKGWSLYHQRDYRDAHRIFSEFVQKHADLPEAPEATYRSAESLIGLKDWARASEIYQQLIEKYKTDASQSALVANSYFRLGESLFQQKKYDAAKSTFESLLRLDPNSPAAASAQYWIAEVLLQQKQYETAIYEYNKVLSQYRSSDVADDARYGIAYAQFSQQNYAQAVQAFKLVAQDPKSPLADASRFYIGESLRFQKEHNSAILYYNKVSPRSDYSDDATYGMATCYFTLRDYARAAEQYGQVLKRFAKSSLAPYAQYQLGVTFYNASQYSEAVETLETFVKAYPDSQKEGARTDEAWYWLARAYYKLSDYRNTTRAAQTVIDRFPNSPTFYKAKFFLAESVYWDGKYEQASTMYKELLRDFPRGEWADKCQYGVGWTYFSRASETSNQRAQAQHYQEAVNAWQQVLSDFPGSLLRDKAQFQTGIALLNLKKYTEAIGAFQAVLTQYAGSDWEDNARYRIAWTFYKQEKYRDAIQAFSEMIQKHPSSMLVPNALFGIGNAYFKTDQFSEAIRYYDEVAKSAPNATMPVEEAGTEKLIDLRPQALYQIAVSYYNLQKYAESIKGYEELVRLYPQSEWADDAQNGIAFAYQQLGNHEMAVQARRKLITKFPQSDLAADVQLSLGRSYYQEGDYTKAIAEFQKVVDRYGQSPAAAEAQIHIGRSYMSLKSFRQAISAFENVPPGQHRAEADYSIGYSWYRQDNPRRDIRQAIQAFDGVVQEYPGSLWARRSLIALGESHREVKDWVKATDAYRRLIKAYPESREATDAQLLLGSSLAGAGRYQEAVRAYQVVTDDDTGRWAPEALIEAWFQMAEAYGKLNKHEDAALAYLRIATVYKSYNPANALISMVRAGAAYESAQKYYDARNWYQRAIRDYAQRNDKTSQMEQALQYAETRLQAVNQQLQQTPGTTER